MRSKFLFGLALAAWFAVLVITGLVGGPAGAQTTFFTVSFLGAPVASPTDCRTLNIDVRVLNPNQALVTGLTRTNFYVIEGSGTAGGVNPISATPIAQGYRLVYTVSTNAIIFPMRVRVDQVGLSSGVLTGFSPVQTISLTCTDFLGGFVVTVTPPIASPTDCRTLALDVRVTNDAIPVTNLSRTNFFIVENAGITGGSNPTSVTATANGYRLVYTTTQTATYPLRVRVEQRQVQGEFTFNIGGISTPLTVTLNCENPVVSIVSAVSNCALSQFTVRFTLTGIVVATTQELLDEFVYTVIEGTTTVLPVDIIGPVVDSNTTTSASLTVVYRTRVATVPQFTLRIRAQRRNGLSAEGSRLVDACIVPPPVASCGTAPAALTLNQAFNFAAAVTGGGQPFTWAYVPQLTDAAAFQNLVVLNNGAVTGTPIRLGAARITLRVTDSFNRTSDSACTFNVTSGNPLTVTCGELATMRGTTGSPYSARASATGGVGAFRWTLADASGIFRIDLSTGTVTGLPTVARNYPVTVGVSDSATPTPVSRSADCMIMVQQAAPPAPVALCGGITMAGTAAVAGQLFTATAAVQNGTGQSPFTWSLDAAPAPPAWLTVRNAGTGEIGGTPPLNSAAATVNISLRVREVGNLQRENNTACSFRLVQPPIDVTPVLAVSTGSSPTTNANATVRLSGPAPAALQGRLDLTFAPDVASPIAATDVTNPSFVNGAATNRRQLDFTINSGGQSLDAPVQVGTVAGTITVRLTSLVRTDTQQSFLPPSAVVQTIVVPRSRPLVMPGSVSLETAVPAGCTASAGATAYVYVRSAFSTSREITGGRITFTVAAGRPVDGAADFTLDANTAFRQAFQDWFTSAPGRQNGGAFGVCIPVTLANGAVADITNVTVQLKNGATPSDSDPVSWR